MNVLLRCNVIVAACQAAIDAAEAKRLVRWEGGVRFYLDESVPGYSTFKGHLWWRKETKFPARKRSRDEAEEMAKRFWRIDPVIVPQRIPQLMAIAKHKMGDGVLIVHDPYLSDIATYLPPYVSERV